MTTFRHSRSRGRFFASCASFSEPVCQAQAGLTGVSKCVDMGLRVLARVFFYTICCLMVSVSVENVRECCHVFWCCGCFSICVVIFQSVLLFYFEIGVLVGMVVDVFFLHGPDRRRERQQESKKDNRREERR